MNYHIILTRQCNLNCMYCHGGEETGPDAEIQYTLDDLEIFLSKDTSSTNLLFYGGEPTIRLSLMLEIMDRFPDSQFMLQTNGLLMHKIPEDYVKRIHSILVSIDGRESTTDFYRSKGVYRHVLENVDWLHKIGYEGDIVARMAVSEQTDIYADVRHLLDLTNPTFKHVHWQLNVIWDAEGNWTDFDNWVEKSYKPGISHLVRDWVNAMDAGIVEGIVPFMPLMHDILTGTSSTLRCGSGLDTFAIHVDGSIGVCPISPDWSFSIVGDIWNTNVQDLQNAMVVEEPCPSCEVFGICGGRCLFANKERFWGEEGFAKVCDTVKQLISSLAAQSPKIRNLIQQGLISIEDFNYPEFNNGCEIIP